MLDMNPPVETRNPAVAGRFYPGDAATLDRDVHGFLAKSAGPKVAARMVMVPHAGYVYSGAIAGETYARVSPPSRAIVLCPNHTGLGVRFSVSPAAKWRLPGGDFAVDAPLRDLLVQRAGLELDAAAHAREHAVEVQLPFLRVLSPESSFVAVCLSRLSLEECRRVGEGIAEAVRASTRNEHEVLLIASTDMSHYVSEDEARAQDMLALDRVKALDPEGLHRTVREHEISMCGYVPTTVALFAARALGAGRVEMVRYGNSGETSGDPTSVVGYAGAFVV
jgi:hypothetical protein